MVRLDEFLAGLAIEIFEVEAACLTGESPVFE
jgi:hypothetical protein